MKTFKLFFILTLCSFFAISCSKDDDEDLGGNGTSDIPIGKVALDQFGMRVLFPEGEWGNYKTSDFENIPGASSCERECIVTYLKESETEEGSNTYSVAIYFSRLIENPIETSEEFDDIVSEFHYIYEGDTVYTNITEIEIFNTIPSYTGSRFDCTRKSGNIESIEENYFIYYYKRIYLITLIMPENLKDQYYDECQEIIKTLTIK